MGNRLLGKVHRIHHSVTFLKLKLIIPDQKAEQEEFKELFALCGRQES